MERSVIKDIFNGVKGSREGIGLARVNKDNLKELSDGYDKLKKRFNAKQIKHIDKFLEVYDKNFCDEVDLYFTEGFKLGLRIAIECFGDE